jgi:hypothetical protein
MSDTPIDITLERLARLEKLVNERFDAMSERFDKMDGRLDQIEGAIGKMVTVLEAHDERLELVVRRLDRLIEQSVRARTEDTSKMSDIERRLRALEERRPAT